MAELLRVCGVPDHLGLEQVCAWPDGKILYTLGSTLPGLAAVDVLAAIAKAWEHIASECGIEAHYTAIGADSRVYSTTGHIDGPAGTLAWAELPCGNIKRSTQKYDTGERKWVIHPEGPPPAGTIDFYRVYLHETCHSLGLPHGGNGLMAPMYSPQISQIDEWTRAELRKRYGPPQAKPKPPNKPAPGGDVMGSVLTFLKNVLPSLEFFASLTKTPVDDALIRLLKELVALGEAGGEQAVIIRIQQLRHKRAA